MQSIVLALLILVSIYSSCAQTLSSSASGLPVPPLPDHVVLRGTVEYASGTYKDSGTVTLSAALDGSVSETWSLSKKTLTYTASSFADNRSCQSQWSDGKPVADASAACYRAIPWFLPGYADSLVASATNFKSDVTADEDRSANQQRFRIAPSVGAIPAAKTSKATAALARFQSNTSVDLRLSSATMLPVKMTYVDKQDSEPAHDTLVEIVYSDYRPELGSLLPHRIQRYVQRALQADITVTSVSVN